MSEMVERVARAITAEFEAGRRVFDAGEAESLARAAIEAMRDHLVQCATRDGEQAYYAAIEEIDEALK